VHDSFYYKSHTDEITTVILYTGVEGKIKRFLYATVSSFMMVQRGQKHVAFCLLKHYFHSDECARMLVDTVLN